MAGGLVGPRSAAAHRIDGPAADALWPACLPACRLGGIALVPGPFALAASIRRTVPSPPRNHSMVRQQLPGTSAAAACTGGGPVLEALIRCRSRTSPSSYIPWVGSRIHTSTRVRARLGRGVRQLTTPPCVQRPCHRPPHPRARPIPLPLPLPLPYPLSVAPLPLCPLQSLQRLDVGGGAQVELRGALAVQLVEGREGVCHVPACPRAHGW